MEYYVQFYFFKCPLQLQNGKLNELIFQLPLEHTFRSFALVDINSLRSIIIDCQISDAG
jgi:hypothetical protein